MNLPIHFPPESEQVRRQLEPFVHATAQERLLAAADALEAAEALSMAGGRRAEQLKYHELCKRQWRQSMAKFIAEHVSTAPRSDK